MNKGKKGPNGNDADLTQFRNLYVPSIPSPWGPDLTTPDSSKHEQDVNYPVDLTEENAADFADISRVGWKSRVDIALKEYEQEMLGAAVDKYDVHHDLNNLLCITISTIMLLASGHWDIPKEYYMYAEMYLGSVKDERGNSPPNIKNLLRHINYIKKKMNIDWGEEFHSEPPSGVTDGRLPSLKKTSKIPVSFCRQKMNSFRNFASSDVSKGDSRKSSRVEIELPTETKTNRSKTEKENRQTK